MDGDEPTITVSAAYSKRRRRDVIPLHPSVVELVREWLLSNPKKPVDKVFDLASSNGYIRSTSKMMSADLAAARVAWIEEEKDDDAKAKRKASGFLSYESNDSTFADFHANRHTFITNLGRSGVSPKLLPERNPLRNNTLFLSRIEVTYSYRLTEFEPRSVSFLDKRVRTFFRHRVSLAPSKRVSNHRVNSKDTNRDLLGDF